MRELSFEGLEEWFVRVVVIDNALLTFWLPSRGRTGLDRLKRHHRREYACESSRTAVPFVSGGSGGDEAAIVRKGAAPPGPISAASTAYRRRRAKSLDQPEPPASLRKP